MTTFSFVDSVLLNAAVAAALAMLVWIIAAIPCIRRRPGLRHCLWVIVLLKLVTPPLLEWSVLPNWFVPEPLPATHPRALPIDELAAVSPTNLSSIMGLQPPTASGPSIDWVFIPVLFALMGTIAVVIRAVIQAGRLCYALRYAAANDARLDGIAAHAGKSMGVASPPPVCVVAANVSPLLWIRRSGPLIVVPRRLCDELSDEQLACVVAHEVAHYRRHDHWTNLLSLLVAAACWWNPVVWWARRELRVAQEACCDALVISRSVASRRKYAETLFQALEFLQAEPSLLPALASGFGSKSSTERRFEMIANPLVNHRLSWWSYPMLLAALLVLPCLPSFTQAQDQASPQRKDVDFDYVPVEFDGDPLDDPNSFRVHVEYPIRNVEDSLGWVYVKLPGQTDRRVYNYQRSKLGVVVLAFERESGKLAWSSEIERPADRKPVAAQRFLLHTGGGVVTIASLEEGSLLIQELDAETGKVTGQTQPAGASNFWSREVITLSDGQVVNDPTSEADQAKLQERINRLQQQQKELQKTMLASDFERQHIQADAEQLRQKLDAIRQQLKEMQTQLKIKEQEQVDAKEVSRQLQRLLDEQFTRVGEEGLGRPQRDWVLRQAKQLGDALVIDTAAIGVKGLTVETAGAVWRLINGNAPIESINMVREGGKDRMIIQGKGKKHRRIILEIRTEGDKHSPWERGEEGTPPGDASQDQGNGASTQRGAVVPTENQVAVAALCWAVKEQLRDKPFTPWLSDKPMQVDWPLDDRFERFAALDLCGVLPRAITADCLRHAWLKLYGLPLTDKHMEQAALSWIKLRQS